MNRIRRVPFKWEHLDIMELRDYERETIDTTKLSALADLGICNTIIFDGRILAILGYIHLFPDVVEVFLLPSQYLPRYGTMFAREVKRLQRALESNGIVRRMQTSSVADDLHDRWMNFLGFTCEAHEMKNFVNGQTYRLWARIY